MLVAEVFEGLGRAEDAIAYARAELADPFNYSVASKLRSGQLLGRCHAARGEHSLSVAAFDAAIEQAKEGLWLRSEAVTVLGRAVAGKEAGGIGGHWPAATGIKRMREVLGRMELGVSEREMLEVPLLG